MKDVFCAPSSSSAICYHFAPPRSASVRFWVANLSPLTPKGQPVSNQHCYFSFCVKKKKNKKKPQPIDGCLEYVHRVCTSPSCAFTEKHIIITALQLNMNKKRI